jgi:uncharacterized lipoprotein YajG
MNRLTTTLAGGLLLAGCAAQQAIKDGKPLDPAQVQADMNNAVFIMKAAGARSRSPLPSPLRSSRSRAILRAGKS